jgi:hypothetical protein
MMGVTRNPSRDSHREDSPKVDSHKVDFEVVFPVDFLKEDFNKPQKQRINLTDSITHNSKDPDFKVDFHKVDFHREDDLADPDFQADLANKVLDQ